MTFNCTERQNILIFSVQGELGRGNDDSFLKSVRAQRDRVDCRIVLDLSGVTFISSHGLGNLVEMAASINAAGGELVLAGLPSLIEGVLTHTRLHQFFNIAPDVDAAIAMLPSADVPSL